MDGLGQAGNGVARRGEARVVLFVKKRRVLTKKMALAMLADSKKTGIGPYRSRRGRFTVIPFGNK